jgi:hypothetical protein
MMGFFGSEVAPRPLCSVIECTSAYDVMGTAGSLQAPARRVCPVLGVPRRTTWIIIDF